MRRLLVLQHLDREGPGLFVPLFEDIGFTVCTFRLELGDSLPELRDGDLLLVMGGPMGLRDVGNHSYPWLIHEVHLIKEALNKKVGIIGICLGAQLLACAAAGAVEVLQDGISQQPSPEIGWHPIFSQGFEIDNNLTTLLGESFSVLHWHGDRVLLPSSAQLIGSSSRCKEQFFKLDSLAYGLQFHIEIKNTTVSDWGCVPEYKSALEKQFGQGALDKFDKEATYHMKQMNHYSDVLYSQFKSKILKI